MPDRLPSLTVLVGFRVPPAVADWVAAGSLYRTRRPRPAVLYATLAAAALAFRRRRPILKMAAD